MTKNEQLHLLSLLVIRGHAKFMGYTRPVQMGYEAMTFSKHINNGGR